MPTDLAFKASILTSKMKVKLNPEIWKILNLRRFFGKGTNIKERKIREEINLCEKTHNRIYPRAVVLNLFEVREHF